MPLSTITRIGRDSGWKPKGGRSSVGSMCYADAVSRWDTFMSASGMAETTRRTYRRALTRFMADAMVDLVTVTEDELMAWFSALPAHGSAKGDSYRALRGFFAWAEGRLRQDDPAKHLRIPRRRLKRAPDLTDEEITLFLKTAFSHNKHWGWALGMFFWTGARLDSLLHVTADDIDFEKGRIYFSHAKANRSYEIPLGRKARIAARHLLADSGDGTLFGGVCGNTLRYWFERTSELSGIKVWPHLCRHAYGTRVARVTDPATVADLMGWSGISEYRRYVSVSEDRARAALEAV